MVGSTCQRMAAVVAERLANQPVAVGGLGGSGTRLVARLLQELGFFLGGESVNESQDSLLFTFLFARPEILVTSDQEFRSLLDSFVRSMRTGAPCDPAARHYVRRLWLRWLDDEPTPGLLAQARVLTDGAKSAAQQAPWGWKEPNTFLVLPRLHRFLPGLRYIHVIRNGVDTAYSQNLGQLLRWGPWLLSRPVAPSPADALSYWCAAHRWVLAYAPRLKSRFLLLNFDRLCVDPLAELPALVSFVGLNWNPLLEQRLLRLIQPPPTLGRYRNLGLERFSIDDLNYVESLGFNIDGFVRPDPLEAKPENGSRQTPRMMRPSTDQILCAMDSEQQRQTPMSYHEPNSQSKRPPSAMRSAILVVGMHRSGTSALTRVLNLLGVRLSSDLMSGVENDNASGFFESIAICNLNDELLAVLGSRWDDWRGLDLDQVEPSLIADYQARARDLVEREFTDSPLFVIKDPRISRLLPFWVSVLESVGAQPLCIISIRNPDEVGLSLKKRNGYSLPRSHLLWLRHVLDAERGARSIPRAFVSYARLLNDCETVVNEIADALKLAWPRPFPQVQTEVHDFLEPQLRHHHGPDADFLEDPNIPDLVRTAYRIVQGATHGGFSPADEQDLTALGVAFDNAIDVLGPALIAEDANTQDLYTRVVKAEARVREQEQTISEQLTAFTSQEESRIALAAEIEKVRAERDESRAAWQALHEAYQQLKVDNAEILADRERSLNDIFASTSWRVTAPLRALSKRKTDSPSSPTQ